MAKKLINLFCIIIAVSVFTTSCQLRTVKTRPGATPTNPSKSGSTKNEDIESSEEPKKETKISEIKTVEYDGDNQGSPIRSRAPQFGVIFSAGGARVWAFTNVLKEMQRYKFPVAATAGVEWGSVIAANYAHRLSANEVEWELNKFKSLNDWDSFVKSVFEKKSVSALRVPFACPSLNLQNQVIYNLNKGDLDQLIPLCLPSPKLVKPQKQSIAMMSDLDSTVQFLKKSGAEKIILFNVIPSKKQKSIVDSLESSDNQIWAMASAATKNPGIDEVVDINITQYSPQQFDKRRDIQIQTDAQVKDLIKRLADKYSL